MAFTTATIISAGTLNPGNTSAAQYVAAALSTFYTKTALTNHNTVNLEVQIATPTISAWSAATNYSSQNAYVLAPDRTSSGGTDMYVSKKDQNIGFNPQTSPQYWDVVSDWGEFELYVAGSSTAVTAANAVSQLSGRNFGPFKIPAVSNVTQIVSLPTIIIPGTSIYVWVSSKNVPAASVGNFSLTVIEMEVQ